MESMTLSEDPSWNIDMLSSGTCDLTGSADAYGDFYNVARFVTGLIFYPIVCIIGLVGNSLGIVVILELTKMASAHISPHTSVHSYTHRIKKLLKKKVYVIIKVDQTDEEDRTKHVRKSMTTANICFL